MKEEEIKATAEELVIIFDDADRLSGGADGVASARGEGEDNGFVEFGEGISGGIDVKEGGGVACVEGDGERGS